MNRRNIFRSLAALAVVGVVSSSFAANRTARAASPGARHVQAGSNLNLINAGFLTVGSDTTYPPMESFANGKYVGADVDLADALAHAMGLKGAKIVNNSFDTIIPALTIRHRFDVIMSSMNDTPERRKTIMFVDYMKAAEAILVRTSSSIRGNSYAALCGHSVSVESSTTELDGLNAQKKKCSISVKIFTKDTDAYQAFASRHTEAYTGDLPVVALYVKQGGGSIRMAGKAFAAGEFYGIGMAKNANNLRRAIRQALQKIRANGQYKSILHKWGVFGAAS
jgi:polar amino acid transport system substrate-binding protein